MKTKSIPPNPSWAWLFAAVAVLAYSWLAPALGGEFDPVGLVVLTAVTTFIIWVEARSVRYWNRHRDYADASKALSAAWSKLPKGQWFRTPDGHMVAAGMQRHLLRRHHLIGRIDQAEMSAASAAIEEDASSVVVVSRFFQQVRGEHRVLAFTDATRCWPDGSEQPAMPPLSRARVLWNMHRAGRTGLLDISVDDLRQLTRELESIDPDELEGTQP